MFSVHLWPDTERGKLLLTISPPHDLCWRTLKKIDGSRWDRDRRRWEFPTSAAAEARVAMQELRAQLADSVVAAAKASLEKKLTAKDQDKLVDEYLTKVVFN